MFEDIPERSGIYVWYRNSEDLIPRFYAGQSVNLRQRTIQHTQQFDHLGLSIKKHGYFSNDNPYGWLIRYYEWPADDLDNQEKIEIQHWLECGWIAYNITGGGQGIGKVDIQQRKSGKTYREGVEYGYNKAYKEIKEYFNKYLDISIKPPTNKIKERKQKEFLDIIGGNAYEL